MSIKSPTKIQPEAPRSSTELATARDEQITAGQTQQAVFDKLRDELPAVTLTGVDALAAHEQKMDTARRNVMVAGARAEEFARLYDDAVRRERDDGLRARRDAAQAAAAKLQVEFEEKWGPLTRQLYDLVSRDKALSAEITAINLLINERRPEGLDFLLPFEHWRSEPAIQARVMVKETPADVGSADVAMLRTVPGEREKETWPRVLKQTFIVGGVGEYRPAPLYDCFALPGLKRDDPNLVVPGTRSFPWWREIA
jgi:hypothetical protein